jgi:hypothetical protein
MPSREPAPERDSDLAAVPAFLRGEPGKRPIAIPRPVTPGPQPAAPGSKAPRIDPATLPMPTLSRRRLVTAAGVIVATLLAMSFLRQVGAATDAASRATDLRAANAVLADEVARLQKDLGHVQDPRYILLEGRAYGLGGPREIPFALAAGAPALDKTAPGSASVRLGAPPLDRTPLDDWLEVLFGSGS